MKQIICIIFSISLVVFNATVYAENNNTDINVNAPESTPAPASATVTSPALTPEATIANVNMPLLEAELIINDTDPTVTEGVRLSWTGVPDIVYYRVFRAEQSGGYSYALTDFAIGGLSYVDVKTLPDKTYYYIVRALISEGNAITGEDEIYGRRSNEVMIEVKSTPPVAEAENGYILMQINNPIMEVNGVKTEVDPGRGTAPFLRDDRTVLPIRAVVEAMDGEVIWDDTEQKISLLANQNRVEMQIGTKEYSVNGEAKVMDIEPFTENERTFIPLRFAAYNLNCRVTWINKTEEILIVYNGTPDIMD